jgi:hypothetical protein
VRRRRDPGYRAVDMVGNELPGNEPSFWYVAYCGERHRKVFQPEREGRDLRDELRGVPFGSAWKPPKYTLSKTGPWPDWMAFWEPLLSAKAMDTLGELLAPHCEFLPWIQEKGHPYTLLNITSRIQKQNWHCKQSSVYNGAYVAADVITVQQKSIPHVFTLEGYSGKTFVSNAVAQKSVECGLRGALFVDPSIPEINLTFIRKPLGKNITAFVRREDDLPADPDPQTH